MWQKIKNLFDLGFELGFLLKQRLYSLASIASVVRMYQPSLHVASSEMQLV